MTEFIQGLSIGLQLDTTGINSSFKDLKRQLKNVDAEMKANMSAFSRGEKSVEKYETQLTGLNRKLEAQKAATNAAKSEYERLAAQHGENSIQAQNAAREFNNQAGNLNNLQRIVNDTTADFEAFRRELEVSESAFGRISDSMETAGSNMSEVGEKLSGIGETMSVGITAPLAGLGLAAIATANEFDDAQGLIQSGLGVTSDRAKELEDVAKSLWENGFSGNVSDAAEAVVTVSKNLADLPTDEIEKITGYAGILADRFEIDISQSTNAAGMVMEAFGGTATEAFDLMTYGLQNAKGDGGELLDVFNEYAPQFSALGYDAEGFMATLVEGSQSGAFNFDLLGDAAKESFLIMGEGSADVKDVLNDLGLDADQVISGINGGGEDAQKSFMAVSAAIAAIKDPTDKTAASIALFGTPIEDLGPQFQGFFSGVEQNLEGVEGATQRAGDALYDNFGAKVESVVRGVKSDLLPVGEILLGMAEDWLPKIGEAIGSVTGKFEEMTPASQKIAVGVGIVAAAIGPILVVLGTMISMLGGVMTALAPFALKIAEAGGLFKYLRGAMLTFTGPVGITVAILAGLTIGFIALYKNSETFRETISNLIIKVKELASQALAILKPAIAGVVGFFQNQLKMIQDFWAQNSVTIIGALENVSRVVGVIFQAILAVIQFVMPAVLALIRAVWGNIKGVITGALDVIMGTVKIFAGLFTGDFSKMWEGLKQVFSGAITFLWNLISLTFFGKLIGGLRVFVSGFKLLFSGMWTTLKSLFSSSVGTLKTTVSGAWSSIASTTSRMFGNIWTFIKEVFTKIKDSISNAVLTIYTKVVTQWTNIFNRSSTIFGTVRDLISRIFTSIRDTISRLVGNVLSKVTGTWNTLKSSTSRIFGDIFTGIKNKFDDIVNAAKALPQRIGDGIGSMASKVKDGVNRVINNLANNLGRGINGVIGGINWVLGKIGVDKDIPKWNIPQYANGTHGHPGGAAIVGDGKGSNAGRELIQTPSGELGLSPSTDTLVNLPKGTQVLSAKKTRELLGNVPRYENGIGKLWEGTKNLAGKAWEGTKNLGSKAKQAAFDVWEHISNPGKLLDTALSLLGIKKPEGGSFIGNMARGAFDKVKSSAVGYVKGQIDNSGTQAGSGNGFGSAFRLTSKRGFRINPVTKRSQIHQGDDWAAAMGTLIPAQAAGKVIQSGFHAIRGNYVRIQSGIMDRLYQHNQRNMVKVGQNVRKGQAVGTVGSTGRSTGAHLHYEVRRNGVNINPAGMETGGIINSEQLIRAGEKNREEIMIPMHPSRRTDAMKLLALAGKKLMPGGDKGITRPNQLPNMSGNGNAMDAILAATIKTNEFLMEQNRLLTQLIQKDANVYMESGALVGAIGDPMDSNLGNTSRNNLYMNGVR